jgi:predicted transcriptional regulator
VPNGKVPKIEGVEAPTVAKAPDRERDPDVASVEEAIAETEAGLYVPAEDVDAWMDSWGTPDELPMPQPKRRPT